MAVKVGRAQRDAIHAEILTALTGTGDIYLAVDEGDYDAARRHRSRFENTMRLLDDLGWDPETPGEEFELTMPADQLARVLRYLTRQAEATLYSHVVEPIEEREHATRSLTAQAAYGDLLGQLAGEAAEGEA